MTDQRGKRAVLLGASGLIGGYCLEHLLADPTYDRVVTPLRRHLDLEHPKLTQRIVSFDHLSANADCFHGDDLFCCLGTTMRQAGTREQFRHVDLHLPLECARLAHENGMRRCLVITALGADPDSRVFYNRVKGELEQALETLGFSHLSILRPSLLRGPRTQSRPGERLGEWVLAATSWLLVGPLRKYRAIHARVVAEALVAQAKREESGVFRLESDQIARTASIS
ncbi:Oxidoreductase [Sulfidibacter corallicola]|uniref:Oxidoreductase n=1 Tax=Sulfidibacter corallicola TaxID=2818388 RepID=A0A8A4U2Z0_SULCO|nr:oxidoreductase [Sulfidibacter corallicola]QTD53105.1 oxidoreductase [Sulfidibacter corallicola]